MAGLATAAKEYDRANGHFAFAAMKIPPALAAARDIEIHDAAKRIEERRLGITTQDEARRAEKRHMDIAMDVAGAAGMARVL